MKGDLDRKWSDWFDGFTITSEAHNETLLTGPVAHQCALHGLLGKIRDLGLPPLSVKRVVKERMKDAMREAEHTRLIRAAKGPRKVRDQGLLVTFIPSGWNMISRSILNI